MTAAEVAALLAQHGLAPHWRKPVKPTPTLRITEDTKATTDNRKWITQYWSPYLGGQWMPLNIGSRTWT